MTHALSHVDRRFAVAKIEITIAQVGGERV